MSLKNFFHILLCAFPAIGLSSSALADSVYGTNFDFGPGKETRFADFIISFKAVRANIYYPGTTRRLSPIYDFSVRSGPEAFETVEQTVSWSKGTGDIGPTIFIILDKCFELEVKTVKADGSGSGKIELVPPETCQATH